MQESNILDNLKQLGAKLREKRQQLGYRQADLAELCGITERTLREVENGSGKVKIEIWIYLGQLLGFDLVFLQKQISYPKNHNEPL